MSAIGRELKFPLDINLQDLPTPSENDGERLVNYIRHMGREVPFVKGILALILEDRRVERSERINETRNLIQYKVGDIVMARVAIQSDSSKNKVAKLMYKSKGPYVIVEDSGTGSYECRKYGKPNGATSKFLTEDLYLLPPQIMPCDEVDTTDLRYLNSDFIPTLKHPFHRDFDVEAYNTDWFEEEPTNSAPEILLQSEFQVDEHDDDEKTNETENTANLQQDDELPLISESITERIDIINPDAIEPELPTQFKIPSTDSLSYMLEQSDDKLFFVQYVPSGTIRPRWFLVQTNVDKSEDTANDGTYFCEFLQRHPSDDHKTDSRSRWWPEWRELQWDNSGTQFEYGRRVLLSPRSKPNLKKYGKFSDNINLTRPNTFLLGPFDFNKKDTSTPANSIVSDSKWAELAEICEMKSLLPPSIGVRRKKVDRSIISNLKERLPDVDESERRLHLSSLEVIECFLLKRGGRGRTS